MSLEILLALLVLAAATVVLATGLLRMDVVALLAVVIVALLGLASPERALAGFANPAVLTVGGMFVLSAGLSRTGVAEWLGQWILRVGGGGEVRLVIAVTLVSGLLSGFMNNVGVAAMLLPVVATIARKSDLPPSKLLIPMALGAQLGGFTTLVGTSPNLLASDALRQAGLEPFGLLSFSPVGLLLLFTGTLLIAAVGPRVLPVRVPQGNADEVIRPGIRGDVGLGERLFHLVVPSHSPLDGLSLADCLIDSALGVHVLAIRRDGETLRAPGPETLLRSGDRIVVQGRPDFFLELRGRRHIRQDREGVSARWLESEEIGLARARIAPGSRFVGRSAAELGLRAQEGVLVLALRRDAEFPRRTRFVDTPLRGGDELLLQGPRSRLLELAQGTELVGVTVLGAEEAVKEFDLTERLWALRVTPDSLLAGRPLGDTRLGDAIGFRVLAVGRDDDSEDRQVSLLPGPELVLESGDHLLVKARPEDMIVLRALQRLEIDLDSTVDPDLLEGREAGFVEVVLAPRSSLVGKTLRQVNFRGRFGMHVVAIVREGEVVRANLREEELRFGDALLLYGPRRQQRALAREPDIILLQTPEGDAPAVQLAPLSLLVTAAALVPVIAGWVPVAIGVLTGAVLMVVTRCLTPDEAYRAVEWPALVLVAGMLALGAALTDTGAIDLVGGSLLRVVGESGAYAVFTVLVLTTAVVGQVIPASAVVVLMAPIAVNGATQLGVSPYPFVMAVAIASTSLASPVAHPAHALVMAPAGYRIGDFLRLGLPVTLLVLAVTLLVTPVFFPF